MMEQQGQHGSHMQPHAPTRSSKSGPMKMRPAFRLPLVTQYQVRAFHASSPQCEQGDVGTDIYGGIAHAAQPRAHEPFQHHAPAELAGHAQHGPNQQGKEHVRRTRELIGTRALRRTA